MNAPRATAMLPPGMSTIAQDVDRTFGQLYWLTVVVFLAVVGTMLVFVLRYRRRPGHVARPVREGWALELGFVFGPIVVLGYFFHQGVATYRSERVSPPDALEIRVVARQWTWQFVHPDGTEQQDELLLPAGRPIRLLMSSSDVIHSFYVPELRLNQDVVPGRFTTVSFEIPEPTGERPLVLMCAEYCGAPQGIRAPVERAPGHLVDDPNSNHSTMMARIRVVSSEEYENAFAPVGLRVPPCEAPTDLDVCWGRHLFRSAGCAGCHASAPDENWPAPSTVRIWGHVRTFEDGTSTVADAAYIREAIREPTARIVRGYVDVRMPSARFSEAQTDAILAYLRSAAWPPAAAEPE